MKRIGFSLLVTALLVALFAFGVSAQDPTPTPPPDLGAPLTQEDTDTEGDVEADIEADVDTQTAALQADADTDVVFLDPDVPITVPLDIRNMIPISMPIFLPTVVTTPQVITIPVTITVALPADDFEGLAPLGAGNAITAPIALQLILTFETSEEISVILAGVPAIVAGTFYTLPLTAEPVTPTAEITQTTIITGANLRAGPGTIYPRVSGLVAGQVVTPVGQDETGTWYQLADGNWVAGFLVANAPTGLPIVEPPLVPPSLPAPAPAEPAAPAEGEPPPAEGEEAPPVEGEETPPADGEGEDNDEDNG
jgi:hypothetical protein